MADILVGTLRPSRRFVHNRKSCGPHQDAMRAGAADCDAKRERANLKKTLAMEVVGKGITVDGVAPGAILTPLNKEAVEDEVKWREAERHIPIKRAGIPKNWRGAPSSRPRLPSVMIDETIAVDHGLSLIQRLDG